MAKPAAADAPFEDAARDAVARRAPALLEHVEGLRARDPYAVHQTRVAARRLRATLEVFEPAFHGRRHRRLLRLVKETADALGDARDLDVQIGYLRGYAEGCAVDDRQGVLSLIRALERDRDVAQERVGPALARLEAEGYEAQVEALLRPRGGR